MTYTIKTLAEHWLCSTDIIYDLIHAGKVRTFRVGRGIRISGAEVERYENEYEKENENAE